MAFKAVGDITRTEKTTERPKSEFEGLESVFQETYSGNTTIEEAERLAARFLGEMMRVSARLRILGLDVRMKKSGLKAVKGTRYLEEARGSDKKPSDVLIGAVLDTDELVHSAQGALDTAETEQEDLERQYGVFKEAHVFYRGMGRGKFE